MCRELRKFRLEDNMKLITTAASNKTRQNSLNKKSENWYFDAQKSSDLLAQDEPVVVESQTIHFPAKKKSGADA
jgi:hypothetical protein